MTADCNRHTQPFISADPLRPAVRDPCGRYRLRTLFVLLRHPHHIVGAVLRVNDQPLPLAPGRVDEQHRTVPLLDGPELAAGRCLWPHEGTHTSAAWVAISAMTPDTVETVGQRWLELVAGDVPH